ncbi:MAG: hypothetical protein JWO05_2229 [Gemmatimonadetes bacterium]|nr:hypothetical protein [Gemmatimonadota bacterium]
MSAPDGGDYRTIVVVGGGCYGSYYVRQLRRAQAAGAIRFQRILVVDRDAGCRVRSELAEDAIPGASVVVAEWGQWFAAFLDEAAELPAQGRDAIVPSPLMPHLMLDWLLSRAKRRWPDYRIDLVPMPAAPPTPWERAGTDGSHYVSHATWECPINCIEPRLCPHTRSERTWSMPESAAQFVATLSAVGERVSGPAVMHCAHRAFGVGMFDVQEVLDADRLVAESGAEGSAQVLVGTMSHCHGAWSLLRVAA